MLEIQVITPRSLRLAEIFTIILGLGLSTLAISVRIYVKLRVSRKFLSEDCTVMLTGHAGDLC